MKMKLRIGSLLLSFIAIACILIPLVLPNSILRTDVQNAFLPPSLTHFLGTDGVGRDILLRLLYGGRVSLFVGIFAMLFTTLIGISIGMASGYCGKKIDRILMNFTDLVLCLPVLAVILCLCSVFTDVKTGFASKVVMISLVIALLDWPVAARIIRAKTLSIKETDYMQACTIIGLPLRRKLFIHLLPNLAPQIIVCATISAGNAILTESAISFLGLGITVPYPSWGNMVAAISDRQILSQYWWVWLPAGLMIVITLLAINLISEGLFEKS